jgi:glycine cleavage system H protein
MAWNIPTDLKYTKNDEWIRVNGDAGVIGISDYAQDQLSDIVYVELPEAGAELKAGTSFGTVESVKAASDLYAPVSGTITAVNDALPDAPELVNSDPYGKAWMVKIKIANAGELDALMDAAAYTKYCEERG